MTSLNVRLHELNDVLSPAFDAAWERHEYIVMDLITHVSQHVLETIS